MFNLLSPILILVLTLVISIIGYLLKKTVMEKLELMSKDLTDFKRDFQSFREDIIKNYVTKEDFKENIESHTKLWTELNIIRERVAAIEPKRKR